MLYIKMLLRLKGFERRLGFSRKKMGQSKKINRCTINGFQIRQNEVELAIFNLNNYLSS